MSSDAQPQVEGLVADDLILLLLAAKDSTGERGSVSGITRLEKLLFLVDKETRVPPSVQDPFVFTPYDYGPYSKAVYEAVELLERAGLVVEDRFVEGASIDELEEEFTAALEPREGVERRFTLTENGLLVADLLAKRYPNVAKALAEIKERYASMPLRRLIRYVYVQYPEYAKASKIRDEIL
jgi:uncharacterized protein